MPPRLTPFPTAATRVVAVGGTGAYGREQIKAIRAAGTLVVAAVAVGRGGEALDGVPVFDRVEDAVAETAADAAIVYTPAAGLRDAVVECVDAGLGFMVAAAEFVPLHDALHALAYARERDAWVVGPNSLGLVVPGQMLLGSVPMEFTRPGGVAVFSRSGTLTMTMCRLLTAAGIGQRIGVHIGGDTLCGRNPHEWLAAAYADPATDIVLYVGEIGGTKEYAMLEAVAARTKPVVCLIVGRHAPEGKRMGHAGALVEGARVSAAAKRAALAEAGAWLADDILAVPTLIGELIRHGSPVRHA